MTALDAPALAAPERSLVPFWLEHRPERSYDEADAAHLVMPNGSLVASFDRPFLAAAGREVLALHRAATAAAS